MREWYTGEANGPRAEDARRGASQVDNGRRCAVRERTNVNHEIRSGVWEKVTAKQTDAEQWRLTAAIRGCGDDGATERAGQCTSDRMTGNTERDGMGTTGEYPR